MRGVAEKSQWHAMAVESALSALGSSEQGLSESDVENRIETEGPNVLPAAKRQPPWLRFLRQFHNVLIYVLLAAALITACLDHVIDTAVILAVVLANAVIGYVQEGKAEKAMEAIRDLLALRATVLRAGVKQRIDAAGTVPGDVELTLSALDAAQVRYLVVGGVAVVLHGHLRVTAELDLVVQLDEGNVRRALAALAGLDFRPRAPVDAKCFQ